MKPKISENKNKNNVYTASWNMSKEKLPSNYSYTIHVMLRDLSMNIIVPKQFEPKLELSEANLKKLADEKSNELRHLLKQHTEQITENRENSVMPCTINSRNPTNRWQRILSPNLNQNKPEGFLGNVIKCPSKILQSSDKQNPIISKPWGVCFTNYKNLLLLTSRYTNLIAIFNYTTNTLIGTIGQEGSEVSYGQNIYFKKPAGITFDQKRSRILVADKDNHRIQIIGLDLQMVDENQNTTNFTFDQNFSYCALACFGQHGQEDGNFDYPWGIDFNSHSDLIAVADSKNNRIQIFNEEGIFLQKFSAVGVTLTYEILRQRSAGYEKKPSVMSYPFTPRGIKFVSTKTKQDQNQSSTSNLKNTFNNRLVITDFESHRLVIAEIECKVLSKEAVDKNLLPKIVTLDPRKIQYHGAFGTSIGRFERPQGIAFDKYNENWLVVDGKNNRIQILDAKSGVPKASLVPVISSNSLSFPVLSDVDFNADGSIAVVDVQSNSVFIY